MIGEQRFPSSFVTCVRFLPSTHFLSHKICGISVFFCDPCWHTAFIIHESEVGSAMARSGVKPLPPSTAGSERVKTRVGSLWITSEIHGADYQ